MVDPVISVKDLITQARLARDRELGPDAMPAFRLSDVIGRQRRAAPLVLLILAAWVMSQFVVIILVRPLMVTRSNGYGLLIILYVFASAVLMNYGIVRVQRRVGLRCPYCGTTFYHVEMKGGWNAPPRSAEDDRRCSRCHAVIIDLEA